MREIKDFGCMVNECQSEASDLIETDPDWGERRLIVLCRKHFDSAYAEGSRVVLEIGDRELLCDTAGSWFFLPGGGYD